MTPTMWKLLAYAAAVAAAIAVLWWIQNRIRVSYQAEEQRDTAIAEHRSYVDAVQASAAVTAAKLERDQREDVAHAARETALQNENAQLSRIVAGTPATVEVSDDQGKRRVSINPSWWLCLSANFTRDATDTAACKASAGDGAAEHGGPGGRVQVPPTVQKPAGG